MRRLSRLLTFTLGLLLVAAGVALFARRSPLVGAGAATFALLVLWAGLR
jgi:hypothetical protein